MFCTVSDVGRRHANSGRYYRGNAYPRTTVGGGVQFTHLQVDNEEADGYEELADCEQRDAGHGRSWLSQEQHKRNSHSPAEQGQSLRPSSPQIEGRPPASDVARYLGNAQQEEVHKDVAAHVSGVVGDAVEEEVVKDVAQRQQDGPPPQGGRLQQL